MRLALPRLRISRSFVRRFAWGFAGWYIASAAIWIPAKLGLVNGAGLGFDLVWGVCAALNVLALTGLLVRRPRFGLGALTATLLNLGLLVDFSFNPDLLITLSGAMAGIPFFIVWLPF